MQMGNQFQAIPKYFYQTNKLITMDSKLEALNKEIITLRRMINGYLASNPELAEMEVRALSFRKKEKENHTYSYTGLSERTTETQEFLLRRCNCSNGNVIYVEGPCPNC